MVSFATQSKSYLANVFLRFLQFIFAITVIGLYGTDLNAARKVGKYSDPKWVCYLSLSLASSSPALLFLFCLLASSWVAQLDRREEARVAGGGMGEVPPCGRNRLLTISRDTQ